MSLYFIPANLKRLLIAQYHSSMVDIQHSPISPSVYHLPEHNGPGGLARARCCHWAFFCFLLMWKHTHYGPNHTITSRNICQGPSVHSRYLVLHGFMLSSRTKCSKSCPSFPLEEESRSRTSDATSMQTRRRSCLVNNIFSVQSQK